MPPPAPPGLDEVLVRLEAIESRLARVEQAVGLARLAVAGTPPPRAPHVDVPPRPDYGVASAAADPVHEAPAAAASTAHEPRALDALRRWLAGGNAWTRIGVVVLFFGVAFLLRHFAELVTLPVELQLVGVASAGLALAALGVRLARGRPGYGLSLQGAGMGIVYLTTFAAFRLYAVLPPLPAIALLVVVAAATVTLALRHDSQPLAGLALAGGFLAPILIDAGATNPVLLFSWFAILNAAIVAISWRRAWRALHVLGFVFTFVLGLSWGWSFYRPRHYATVQPFLALFFLFYVAIAILDARRRQPDASAQVDGVLVFGVPLVGFALQAGIVREHAYGAACSAALLALFYAVLWLVLRRRSEGGLARLASAFAALAIVFTTLTMPLALDARWTSAGWAIEAAAVYWLGVLQRQRAARLFALVVALAAAAAFVWDAPAAKGLFLANAAFLGATLIGLAALAIAFVADRHADRLGAIERKLVPFVFAWGAAWWLAAGVIDIDRWLDGATAVNAMVGWVVGSVAVAIALARVLRWPRADWIVVVVLPALALAAFLLLDAERSTLVGYGWLAWPLAWVVHAYGLRAVESGSLTPTLQARVRDLHVLFVLALLSWFAWEASEWVGRVTHDGTVWMACAAALPGIAYLAASPRFHAEAAWPIGPHVEAYGRRAGRLVAFALATWFVGVNLVSPGDAAPLPYVPLATPVDATLAAALLALWRWSGAWGQVSASRRQGVAAMAAFLALNATIVRTVHHWGGVPWHFDALLAYRPLQGALTLAWTVCALGLMVGGTRRGMREAWMAGASLLGVVVLKLFVVDLAALGGLTRVIAFLGAGALLLVVGYAAPLPPTRAAPSRE